MSATFSIFTEGQRREAVRLINEAPLGFFLTARRNKRTLDQNSRMWAMLTVLSQKLTWHGQKLSPEDWKIVMMAGLEQELRVVPNIHGNGFVPLGRSSSKLSKAEFTELMDLIEAFAAQRGVELWPEEEAA